MKFTIFGPTWNNPLLFPLEKILGRPSRVRRQENNGCMQQPGVQTWNEEAGHHWPPGWWRPWSESMFFAILPGVVVGSWIFYCRSRSFKQIIYFDSGSAVQAPFKTDYAAMFSYSGTMQFWCFASRQSVITLEVLPHQRSLLCVTHYEYDAGMDI